eukprot:11186832-Ditylum_brightwellii.AAC.1
MFRSSSREFGKECIVEEVAYLRIPGQVIDDPWNTDGDLDGDLLFKCHGNDGSTTILDIDKEQRGALYEMFASGSMIPGETLLDISEAITAQGVTSLPSGKINVTNIGHNNRRSLVTTAGTKRFLAVKVEDANGLQLRDSTGLISDNIFGSDVDHVDRVNLKSQLFACSYGDLKVSTDYSAYPKINKHIKKPGVIEVKIDADLKKDSSDTIEQAVTAAVEKKLDIKLPGPFHHVMYLLKGCYDKKTCGWAGYAYVNNWKSVYQGSYYYMVGVQVHEL